MENHEIHLENARKLRGIYFIDPEDKEFKKPSRTRVRSWKHQWLLLCLVKIMKNCGSDGSYKIKTRLACILEADESTRLRCESRNNHRYAVVVQDLATQWIQALSVQKQTSQETQRSLQKFLEPERKPKVIYTDNSLEFGKACEDLSWNHCTSTPHRSETNGIAERAVRRVKEGTSSVLLQSGLDENWWADSMNVTPICGTSQISYLMGRRPMKDVLGSHLKDLFGSLVDYHPVTAKDQSRIHQFGQKSLTWIVSSDTLCTRGKFARVTY